MRGVRKSEDCKREESTQVRIKSEIWHVKWGYKVRVSTKVRIKAFSIWPPDWPDWLGCQIGQIAFVFKLAR